MALSNIFREPGREITETLVGIAVVGTILAVILPADYYFARWFEEITGGANGGCPWPLGMILIGPMAAIGVGLVAVFIHEVGDIVCDSLEERGIQMRPRRRY